MKIIISESQFVRLQENQREILDMFDTDYLNLLYRKTKKGPNNPARKLLALRTSLENESLVRDLNQSVETLYKFFASKNVGILPKILELSLEDPYKAINNLKIIADFINDEEFSDDITKKQLSQLRNMSKVPNNLEELLKNVREKEYSKYEKGFVGNQFELKRTSLSLNYKCSTDLDKSFFKKVQRLKSVSPEEFKELLVNIKDCVSSSLENEIVTKSDIVSTTPLYVMDNGQKVEVFPKGSNFEVKKMDTNIDSYLSEFFSIFKSKEVSQQKGVYLEVYNTVIKGIYSFVKDKGQKYLDNIKKNMSGIVFENYTIVPIEYIEFYWSNIGQKKCDELRLSIRFRIKPEYRGKTIPSFVYKTGSDILEEKELKVSPENFEYKICE
jgi:hypothetical protein